MPDNRTLLRGRLGQLGLGACREEEVFRELGEHLDDQAAEPERKVGRQTMEIDFLRRCSRRVIEQRKLQALTREVLVWSRERFTVDPARRGLAAVSTPGDCSAT